MSANHQDVQTIDEAWRDGARGLLQAWRYVCENIDYIPVFELAANILDILIDGRAEMQVGRH